MGRTTRSMAIRSNQIATTVSTAANSKSLTKKPATKRRNKSSSSPSSLKKKTDDAVDAKIETVVERTVSFQPISDRTFNPDSKVKIHTLLLGTHPSVKSLAKSQYYAHPMK